MKLLTANDILAAKDTKIELVDVPEWGGAVHVRQFTAAQRDEFDALLFPNPDEADPKPDTSNLRAKVVALAACDANGRPLFTLEQLEQIAAKSDAPVSRIYEAAARLNRLRKSDRDAEKKG